MRPLHYPNERVLGLAQRVLGTMAYLHRFGVRLHWFNRAESNRVTGWDVQLFDLEELWCRPPGDLVSESVTSAHG